MGGYSELINLIISIFMLGYIVHILRKFKIKAQPFWYVAIFFLVLSRLFTVLEHALWFDFFNFLEHFSITLVALSVLIAVIKTGRRK